MASRTPAKRSPARGRGHGQVHPYRCEEVAPDAASLALADHEREGERVEGGPVTFVVGDHPVHRAGDEDVVDRTTESRAGSLDVGQRDPEGLEVPPSGSGRPQRRGAASSGAIQLAGDAPDRLHHLLGGFQDPPGVEQGQGRLRGRSLGELHHPQRPFGQAGQPEESPVDGRDWRCRRRPGRRSRRGFG